MQLVGCLRHGRGTRLPRTPMKRPVFWLLIAPSVVLTTYLADAEVGAARRDRLAVDSTSSVRFL